VDAGSREENASKQNLDPVLIPSEPKKLWDRSSRGDWSSISGWLQKDLQPAACLRPKRETLVQYQGLRWILETLLRTARFAAAFDEHDVGWYCDHKQTHGEHDSFENQHDFSFHSSGSGVFKRTECRLA
jgi:hypothetical protein